MSINKNVMSTMTPELRAEYDAGFAVGQKSERDATLEIIKLCREHGSGDEMALRMLNLGASVPEVREALGLPREGNPLCDGSNVGSAL